MNYYYIIIIYINLYMFNLYVLMYIIYLNI